MSKLQSLVAVALSALGGLCVCWWYDCPAWMALVSVVVTLGCEAARQE
jgi:hypothetical protein